MKYLFINVLAGSGSTGRIAAEQCRELQRQGHQCVLAYGRGKAMCPDVETYLIGSPWNVRLHGLRSRFLDDVGAGSRAATRQFLKWVGEFDPDVIWLHNLHGYYINLELLFGYLRSCGKEIHWTLHDCWAFTGHCAYYDFAKCHRWKTGCHDCPEKHAYPKSMLRDNSAGNYIWKKSLFTGIENLRVRVPSNWLKSQTEESFLREYPVEVVYNTVDREIFQPTSSDLRRKYALEEKKVLLGVANVWDMRKGLKDFVALEKLLGSNYQIVLIGLSPKQLKELPKSILGLPRTDSVQQLAEWYSAADVYVNLTYEDNYPTTNLEAQACGTPCITYRTGGSVESVPAENVVEQGDLAGLLALLEKPLALAPDFRKERA